MKELNRMLGRRGGRGRFLIFGHYFLARASRILHTILFVPQLNFPPFCTVVRYEFTVRNLHAVDK